MISNAGGWPRGWGWAYMVGSLAAGFAYWTVTGAVVQGIPLSAGSRFACGSFDFLSGYLLTSLATVALYALPGRPR